jgi:hypothetical protein
MEWMYKVVGEPSPASLIGSMGPWFVTRGGTLGIDTFFELLDKEGGWMAWREGRINDVAMMKQMASYVDHQGGLIPVGGPFRLNFLPGKSSIQENFICQIRNGEARNVRHRDGKLDGWVPPKVIPERSPCPPGGGWMAPPLEGSIHYGYPWDEDWTFEKFVSTYNIPLWWAIMQWGNTGPDYEMQKDLVYKTLDKYFTVKQIAPQERVKMLEDLKEMYYLPGHWVEWINEYIDKL